MPTLEDFSASVRRLAVGDGSGVAALPVILTRATVEVLSADGASLSLLSENVRMPLGADSPASTTAEQLQFTLGEGPCLDVYRTQQPHFFDAAQIAARWPVYASELRTSTPYRSCSSSPVDLGDTLQAALDLYWVSGAAPSAAETAAIAVVTAEIERELRQQATGADAATGPSWLRTESMRLRANVWIALALAATTRLDGADALTVMRSFAYSSQITMDELARRLADRELDIHAVLNPPEDRPG